MSIGSLPIFLCCSIEVMMMMMMMMMAKSGGKKNSNLTRIVQERAKMKAAEEEEKKKKQFPLTQDCVSCILLRLPIDSLQRSTCVCKLWHRLIHNPALIQSHADRSEAVILFQTSAPRSILYSGPPAGKQQQAGFSVEDRLIEPSNFFNRPDIRPWSKLYIHFLEISNGKGVIKDFNISCFGKIVASCNGLILLENQLKTGGLILMNPVTRQLVALPVGTISVSSKRSYAIVFDSSTAEYKVVHLFHDGYDYPCCEILVVGARSWKMVDPPSYGLISWFGYKPVSAIGALHWLPHIDHNDYIVSMETGEEKFKTIKLPKSGRTRDRILEMGGFLCFATHEEMEIDRIDIWALKNLSDENWTKIHYARGCSGLEMIPTFGSRFGGKIIFTRDEDSTLYVYDFQLISMSKIEMRNKERCPSGDSYLPHVNSLVSWEKGGSKID